LGKEAFHFRIAFASACRIRRLSYPRKLTIARPSCFAPKKAVVT
jgi:hypothetical protein